MANSYHKPVLLHDSIRLLDIREGGIYVDATFGGGGHSAGILQELQSGRLFAFDKDSDALANKIKDDRLELIQSDFRFIENELNARGIEGVDGILADLGVSSHQFDTPRRGFSFRFEGPLDMRMAQDADLSAEDVLNGYDAEDLATLFREFGEIRSANRLAEEIVKSRVAKPLETTRDLEEVVGRTVAATNLRKILTLVFQALRIEVNDEMSGLEEFLAGALEKLKPGGRLAVIAYHSLEDRRVKNFFRSGNFDGKEERDFFGKLQTPWKLITRKAVMPTEAEIEENPRARSARLRVAEKI